MTVNGYEIAFVKHSGLFGVGAIYSAATTQWAFVGNLCKMDSWRDAGLLFQASLPIYNCLA